MSKFLRSLMVFFGLFGVSGILLLANSSSAHASTIYTWDVVLGDESDQVMGGGDHVRETTSNFTIPVGTVLTLDSVSLAGDTTACASEGWNAQLRFPYDKDAEAASDSFNGPGFNRPQIFWSSDASNLNLAVPSYTYEGDSFGSWPTDPFVTHVTGEAQSFYFRVACGPSGFSGPVTLSLRLIAELPADATTTSTVAPTTTSTVELATTTTPPLSSNETAVTATNLGGTIDLPVTGNSSNSILAVALIVLGFGTAIGVRRRLPRSN